MSFLSQVFKKRAKTQINHYIVNVNENFIELISLFAVVHSSNRDDEVKFKKKNTSHSEFRTKCLYTKISNKKKKKTNEHF